MYVYLDTKFNMMRFKPLEAFHPHVNVGNKVSVVNAPSNLTPIAPVSDTTPLVYFTRTTNKNTVDYIITNDQQDTNKNLSIQVKPNMLISTDFKSNKNIKQLAKEANCFNAVKVIRETE